MTVMGGRNENSIIINISLDNHLTFQKRKHKFRYLLWLYGQKIFYKNQCKITPSEDMNEGAAQK